MDKTTLAVLRATRDEAEAYQRCIESRTVDEKAISSGEWQVTEERRQQCVSAWRYARYPDADSPVDPVVVAKHWAEVTGYGLCEGCNGPAEYRDSDDVPLCERCWDTLEEIQG